MMFDEKDRRQIEMRGMTVEKVEEQIAMFQRGAPFLRLMSPCTRGDGIVVIEKSDAARYLEQFSEVRRKGRVLKFVPASGAATRMFKFLHEAFHTLEQGGTPTGPEYLRFMENLERFPFYGLLRDVLQKAGKDLEQLQREGDARTILDYLLYDKGLDVSNKPKALIPFHMEIQEKGDLEPKPQIPVRSHLLEASAYACDAAHKANLHFTISPEHEDDFEEAVIEITARFQTMSLNISWSFQDPATDTVAVNPDNTLFRDEETNMVFRPGGHGALINNLNKLEGDVVFVKNIDNILPDWLKRNRIPFKGVMGGLLAETQNRIFRYLELLEKSVPTNQQCEEILDFIANRLGVRTAGMFELTPEEAGQKLFDLLNRPLRVCSMVRNEGQPGGGPFWIEERDGTMRVQIVESAQIDKNDQEQLEIMESSTHFNPVDIVCGLRDYKGRPFDLSRFVDPDTYFISSKSKNGRDLKALELPGLWNGAMARWNSVFVEMPLLLFNPVKTVNDLLKHQHQPEPEFVLNRENYGWALDVLFR